MPLSPLQSLPVILTSPEETGVSLQSNLGSLTSNLNTLRRKESNLVIEFSPPWNSVDKDVGDLFICDR